MLRSMSIREFEEWRAYADLEPFDEVRADLRAASIVQTLLNVHRRKGRPPFALEECVLRFGVQAQAKPRSADQARAEVGKTMDMLMMIYNTPPEQARRPRVRRAR